MAKQPIPLDATVYVYGIADNSGAVRYVGSSRDPEMRLKQHAYGQSGTNAMSGLDISTCRLLILDVTTQAERLKVEGGWIQALVKRHPLGNRMMTAPKVDLPTIHVPFPLPLYEALRLAAFQDRVSISEMVRRACAAHVAKRPVAKEVK